MQYTWWNNLTSTDVLFSADKHMSSVENRVQTDAQWALLAEYILFGVQDVSKTDWSIL